MDWKPIISDLMTAGVTQKEIGKNVGLKQPSVSDLARGVTTEVGWSVGEKLLALHAKHCRGELRQASYDVGGAASPQGDHQAPSRLRPRPASGQGANLGCPIEDPELTAVQLATDAQAPVGARRTAGSDMQEVA